MGPVDGLGHPRPLHQIEVPQAGNGVGDLARQLGVDSRRAQANDLDLPRRAGVVDPVVEATALEGVVELAGPVGGQYDDRWRRTADGWRLAARTVRIRGELGDRSVIGL